MEPISVLVNGSCGRMGREVVKTVLKDPELYLAGAVDKVNQGKDIADIIGLAASGTLVNGDLQSALLQAQPQVVVDFTTPSTVMDNLRQIMAAGIHAVVGTTGLNPDNLQEIGDLCKTHCVNVLVAPNFAIGALLMMRFAAMAAKFFPQVEIIELHHDQKMDAPSGTSIKTAELILESRTKLSNQLVGEEKIRGVRGGQMEGIDLHSVRLPGLIAHQEVIFGGEGQILTIRHDSLSRESFMPGVVTAIKQIGSHPGLSYGLDQYLF